MSSTVPAIPVQHPIAARSAGPPIGLIENSCSRCVRRAYEHGSEECEAEFDLEGNMLVKCMVCADSRADCVSIPKRHETITGANHVFRLRRRFEMTVANDLDPGDPGYTSTLQLMNATNIYEKILNAHQRVIDRFGGAKKPDALSIQVDQAKSLRAISTTLTGILDVLLFSANLPTQGPLDTRRLERLSSTDWQEVRQEEQVREAVRAREQAAKREMAREQCVQSVMDWERAKMKRLRNQGLGKKERRADVEDDGRVVF